MEQKSDLFVEHHYFKFQDEIQFFSILLRPVTFNNASSDYWANGLLSDYIGWTSGLSDYWANGLRLELGLGPVRGPI